MKRWFWGLLLVGGIVLYPNWLMADLPIAESIVQAKPVNEELRLVLPFNVSSNWTSAGIELAGIIVATNQKSIKFAVQNGQFVSMDPNHDTWFVYGWFGPISAVEKSYNIKYPKWGNRHNGIDFAGKTGLEIISASDGKVIFAGTKYGQTVEIISGEYKITYAHLNDSAVKVGDRVNIGDLLGYLGNSGTVNPHLHFEVDQIINGKQTAINPLNLIDTDWGRVIIPDLPANQFTNDRSPFEQANFTWSLGIGVH